MLKHIAIGILIPYVVFLVIYVRNKFQIDDFLLSMMPYILFLCAGWSILPNVFYKIKLDIMNNFFVSNVFFFHGVLRRWHTTGSTWGLGIIFFVFFSLLIIYARHLHLQECKIRMLNNQREHG